MLIVMFSNERDALNVMICHENVLATGDEEGVVKLWDLRQSKEIFTWNENEDYISDLCISAERNTLLATR